MSDSTLTNNVMKKEPNSGLVRSLWVFFELIENLILDGTLTTKGVKINGTKTLALFVRAMFLELIEN